MGQFKPMVKMMTTEPSVELKLKKGGSVSKEKKMQMGGALAPTASPAPAGMPARGGMMPAGAPMTPSLAARRRMMRGMPAGAAPAGPVGSAGAVMKAGGETKKEHKAEMSKMASTEKKLKEHAAKPASKAHAGLKTGGVVKGQGGYATGGVVYGQGGYKHGGKVKKYAAGGIITEKEGSRDAGEYKNTKMVTTKPDHSPAKTGGVKLGNGGGYKKGGAAKKYADGGAITDYERKVFESKSDEDSGEGQVTDYERKILKGAFKKDAFKGQGKITDYERKLIEGKRKGGTVKKYAQGGAVNDSGKAESMPQGHKKPSAPVSITQLSGSFKKGGAVMTPAEKRLTKVFDKENAPAMKAAKSKDVEIYSKYGKKMRYGGSC